MSEEIELIKDSEIFNLDVKTLDESTLSPTGIIIKRTLEIMSMIKKYYIMGLNGGTMIDRDGKQIECEVTAKGEKRLYEMVSKNIDGMIQKASVNAIEDAKQPLFKEIAQLKKEIDLLNRELAIKK